jgi:hypothetical protein
MEHVKDMVLLAHVYPHVVLCGLEIAVQVDVEHGPREMLTTEVKS